MSIANRKERDREDLRKRILQAAMELLVEKGEEQTSLRAIAERIEYSPTTIYLHFKDKDALFYALHQEGFEMLKAGFTQLLTIADPFERIILQGYGYLEFALNNPKLYDLMFMSEMPISWIECLNKEWNEGRSGFLILQANVVQCQQLGYMAPGDPEITSFWIWSTLHGMIALQNRQRVEHAITEQNRFDVVKKGYAQFVNTLTIQKNALALLP